MVGTTGICYFFFLLWASGVMYIGRESWVVWVALRSCTASVVVVWLWRWRLGIRFRQASPCGAPWRVKRITVET